MDISLCAGKDQHSKDGVLGLREIHQMMLYIKISYCIEFWATHPFLIGAHTLLRALTPGPRQSSRKCDFRLNEQDPAEAMPLQARTGADLKLHIHQQT